MSDDLPTSNLGNLHKLLVAAVEEYRARHDDLECAKQAYRDKESELSWELMIQRRQLNIRVPMNDKIKVALPQFP